MRATTMAWPTLLTLALSVVACGGGGSGAGGETPEAKTAAGGGSSAASAAARAEAGEIFATRCTPCHGPTGQGDGAASAGLTPPPRNFGDAAWQGSVTDEHVEKIIQYGGMAVGKSAAMPPNPDLMSKPDVVRALREHVRSLQTK